MTEINLTDVLTTVGGLITGGGLTWLVNWRSRMRVAKAEADTAVSAGYEARLEECHKTIQYLNQTEAEHAERIKTLNHTIDDKTDRIRELTAKIWQSEQERGRVQDLLNDSKDRLIRLTEERDEERRVKEYYRRWRCEKSSCLDPEGRRPPNSRLASETYTHPE